MAEVSLELILEMLRRIQSDVSDLKADTRAIEVWLGAVETQIAPLHVQTAEISVRMDRRDDPMERVMRRLELTDASH